MRKYLILLIISLSSIFAQNWTIEQVDTFQSYESSITIDNQNYPHIAYFARRRLGVNLYFYWVKYARWNGVGWEFQPVETTVSHISFFIVSKLCLDNQNRPHIVFTKDSVQFKYAYYDGNTWQISIIDSFNVSSNEVLRGCIDMVLTESGVPHISYSFINYIDSISGIKYASRSGDSWIIQTVWQENRILTSYLSTLAIDFDNAGYPVIAFEIYHHRSSIDTGFLYCAHFNGQTWKIDTVEIFALPFTFPYWVYSLKVNNPDQIHIFYQCVFGLFHAKSNGDSWAIEFIDSNGIGDAAGDMILDGDKPNVVYSSTMDPLTYAYKVDTLWNYEVIDSGELGLFPSITQDNENRLHVSYFQDRTNYLCYAQRVSPSIAEKGIRSIAVSKTRIEIYPNPAKGVMRVRIPPTYCSSLRSDDSSNCLPHQWGEDRRRGIKIFDVSGKLIKVEQVTSTQEHKQKIEIPLKGINPGIYFLQIGTELKKFLIIK